MPNQLEDRRPVRARRNRTQLVCTECHRLKIKCDMVSPCSRCIKRGIPEKCRIESHTSASTQENNISSGFQVLSFSPPASPLSPPTSESDNVSPAYEVLYTTELPSNGDFSIESQEFIRTVPSLGIVSLIRVIDHHSRQNTAMAIRGFLCADTHDLLLQTYFEECHWMSEIIYPKSFNANSSIDWSERPISDAYSFAALLLAIHSHVRTSLPQWCSENLLNSDARADTARTLALGCIDSAKQFGSLTVEALQAMIFVGSCRKEEGDMSGYREILLKAIHEAQLLEYHLNPDLSIMTIVEGEKRRNVWINLYRHDRFASLLMCIPHMIASTKVKFPVLLLDGSILPASGADPSSAEGIEANQYTDVYCLLMTKLADIAGRIIDYSQGEVSYSETLILDKDLQIFEQSMPRDFGTARSSNKQRYVIYLITFTMRVSLFQSLLIRLIATSQSDARPVQACQISLVHSAMTLIQMYRDILQDLSKDCLQWGIFVHPLSIAIGILLDTFLREPPTTPSDQCWLYYKVANDGRGLLEKMSFPGSKASEAMFGLQEKLQMASHVI